MKLSTSGLRLAAGAAVDLHLHSHYSDGDWRPEALLDHLRDGGFALAAIADHDRVDTTAGLQQLAQEKRMPLLAAVEMTARWRGEMTDLLCYGFDPQGGALHELAGELLRRQQENTRAVCENLARRGAALPPEAVAEILAAPACRQPQALVALLAARGFGRDGPAAGRLAAEAGCRLATSDLAEVVEAAHRSGAVCLIAHPGRGDGWLSYDAGLLDEVRREAPIDGLEVTHPLHTPAQTAAYEAYARRRGLLISAGSDSHRPEKPPIRYRAGACRALLERLGIEVG